MISGFEWVVLVVLSTVLVSLALLIALWFEAQRLDDAWTLSRLGEPLGMRYRVMGRDCLSRPEPFVLHERTGAVADNSVIERSLVSSRPHALPAVFEYVTYRDRMGLRRYGAPFLVLAVRVPAGTPGFRLRPQGLCDRLVSSVLKRAPRPHGVPPGWVLHMDGSEGRAVEQLAPHMDRLTASSLWIQVSERALFVGQSLRSWQPPGFTPRGVERLVHRALPVLKALGSPDTPNLEALMHPRATVVQAAGGSPSAELE